MRSGGATGTDGRSLGRPTNFGKMAPKRSVHGAGSPLLMSPTVRIPAATARSPHRRSAVQNAVLHFGPQKRCGLPPRRGRNDLSHQSQIIEVSSIRVAAPNLPGCLARYVARFSYIGRHGVHGPNSALHSRARRARISRLDGITSAIPFRREALPWSRLRTGSADPRLAAGIRVPAAA